MRHIMKVQPEPFNKLQSGKKVIESRLYDEKRRQVDLGDTIEFQKEPDQKETCMMEVVGLLRYPSFEALINDFPPHYFGGETKEQLLDEFFSFYTPEKERRYTVLGIRLRRLNN